jgi:PAS domain S-box-containing protein
MESPEQDVVMGAMSAGDEAGAWIIDDGAMGAQIRGFPWASTSLGPLSSWSTTLRVATNVLLATPVPMALLWSDDLVVLYNDAYRALSIEREQDALGRPAREVWADIADVTGPIFEHVHRGGDALEFQDQHFRVRRNGGLEDAWFTVSYAGVRERRDRVLGVLIVVQETTRYLTAERRLQESQRLLRDIIDSTPALVFALDHEQRYILVNEQMASFARRPREALLGQTVGALYPPATCEVLARANAEILRTGVPVHAELTLAPRGSDMPRTLLVTKFAIRNASGDVTGVGGVAADITTLKRQEEELLAQKKKAESSARMKAAFLDIAAHELRNPVTVLSLLLQLYQDAARDGAVFGADELVRLREPVDRLSRLVVELLNVARLERGMVALQRHPTDLRELVDACVDEFRVLFPARALRALTPAEPVVLEVDPVRIHQVVANLVDNALKYAPEGPVEVVLREDDDKIYIDVVDHGPGVDATSLDELFEAFSRGRAASDRERPAGLGLGLSVCKGIAELHGGVVEVHSTPGHGSTFTVILPRSAP